MKFCQVPNNTYLLYNSNVFTPCNAKLKTPFPEIPKLKENIDIWNSFTPYFINTPDEGTFFNEFITFVGFLGIRRKQKNKVKDLLPVSSYGFRNSSVSKISSRRSKLQLRHCACAVRIQDSIYKHHKRNLAKLETKRSLSLDNFQHNEKKTTNNVYGYPCKSQESNNIAYDKHNLNVKASNLSSQSKTVYGSINSYASNLSDQSKIVYGKQSVISHPSNSSNKSRVVYSEQSGISHPSSRSQQNKVIYGKQGSYLPNQTEIEYSRQNINSQVSCLSDQSKIVYVKQSINTSEWNNITYDQQPINSEGSYLPDQTNTAYGISQLSNSSEWNTVNSEGSNLSDQTKSMHGKQHEISRPSDSSEWNTINSEGSNLSDQTKAGYAKQSRISQQTVSDQSKIIYTKQNLSDESKIKYGKQSINSEGWYLSDQTKSAYGKQSRISQPLSLSNWNNITYAQQPINSEGSDQTKAIYDKQSVISQLSQITGEAKMVYGKQNIVPQASCVSNQSRIIYGKQSIDSQSSYLSNQSSTLQSSDLSNHSKFVYDNWNANSVNQSKVLSNNQSSDLSNCSKFMYDTCSIYSQSSDVSNQNKLTYDDGGAHTKPSSKTTCRNYSWHLNPTNLSGQNKIVSIGDGQEVNLLPKIDNNANEKSHLKRVKTYHRLTDLYMPEKMQPENHLIRMQKSLCKPSRQSSFNNQYSNLQDLTILESSENTGDSELIGRKDRNLDVYLLTEYENSAFSKPKKRYRQHNTDCCDEGDTSNKCKKKHHHRGVHLPLESYECRKKKSTQTGLNNTMDVFVSTDLQVSPTAVVDKSEKAVGEYNKSSQMGLEVINDNENTRRHCYHACVCGQMLEIEIFRKQSRRRINDDVSVSCDKVLSVQSFPPLEECDKGKRSLKEIQNTSATCSCATELTEPDVSEQYTNTAHNGMVYASGQLTSGICPEELRASIYHRKKSQSGGGDKNFSKHNTDFKLQDNVKQLWERDSSPYPSDTNINFINSNSLSKASASKNDKAIKEYMPEDRDRLNAEVIRILKSKIDSIEKLLLGKDNKYHFNKPSKSSTNITSNTIEEKFKQAETNSETKLKKYRLSKELLEYQPSDIFQEHRKSSSSTPKMQEHHNSKVTFQQSDNNKILTSIKEENNYLISSLLAPKDNVIRKIASKSPEKHHKASSNKIIDNEDFFEELQQKMSVLRKSQESNTNKGHVNESNNLIYMNKDRREHQSACDEEFLRDFQSDEDSLPKGEEIVGDNPDAIRKEKQINKQKSVAYEDRSKKKMKSSKRSKDSLSSEDEAVETEITAVLKKGGNSLEEKHYSYQYRDRPKRKGSKRSDSKKNNKSWFGKQTVSDEEIYDDTPIRKKQTISEEEISKRKNKSWLKKQTVSDEEIDDDLPAKHKQTTSDKEVIKVKNKSWLKKQTVSDEKIFDNAPAGRKKTISEEEIDKRKNKSRLKKQTISDEEIDADVPAQRKQTSDEKIHSGVPSNKKSKGWLKKQTISDEDIDSDVVRETNPQTLLGKQTGSDDELYGDSPSLETYCTCNKSEENVEVEEELELEAEVAVASRTNSELLEEEVLNAKFWKSKKENQKELPKENKNLEKKQTSDSTQPQRGSFRNSITLNNVLSNKFQNKKDKTPPQTSCPGRCNEEYFMALERKIKALERTVYRNELPKVDENDDELSNASQTSCMKNKNKPISRRGSKTSVVSFDVSVLQDETEDALNSTRRASYVSRLRTKSKSLFKKKKPCSCKTNDITKSKKLFSKSRPCECLKNKDEPKGVTSKVSFASINEEPNEEPSSATCVTKKAFSLKELEKKPSTKGTSVLSFVEQQTSIPGFSGKKAKQSKTKLSSDNLNSKPVKQSSSFCGSSGGKSTKQRKSDVGTEYKPEKKSSGKSKQKSDASTDYNPENKRSYFCGPSSEKLIQKTDMDSDYSTISAVSEEELMIDQSTVFGKSASKVNKSKGKVSSKNVSQQRSLAFSSNLFKKGSGFSQSDKANLCPSKCDTNKLVRNLQNKVNMLEKAFLESTKCQLPKVEEEEVETGSQDLDTKSLLSIYKSSRSGSHLSTKNSSMSESRIHSKIQSKNDEYLPSKVSHSAHSFIHAKTMMDDQPSSHSTILSQEQECNRCNEPESKTKSLLSQFSVSRLKAARQSGEQASKTSLLSIIASKIKSKSRSGRLASQKHILSGSSFSRLKTARQSDEQSSKTSLLSIASAKAKSSTQDGKLASHKSLLAESSFSKSKTARESDEESSKASLVSCASAKAKSRSQANKLTSQKSVLAGSSFSKSKTARQGSEQSSKASVISVARTKIENESQSDSLPSKASLLSQTFSKLKAARKSGEQSSKTSLMSIISARSRSGKAPSKASLLSQKVLSRLKIAQQDSKKLSKKSLLSIISAKAKSRNQTDKQSITSLLSQSSTSVTPKKKPTICTSDICKCKDHTDVQTETELIKADGSSKTRTPPSKKSLLSQTMFSKLRSKSHTDEPSSRTSHLSESINFGRRKSSSKTGKLLSQALFSRQKSLQEDDEQISKSSTISCSSVKVKRQSSSQSDEVLSQASLLKQSGKSRSHADDELSETDLVSQSLIASKAKSGSKSGTPPSKKSVLSQTMFSRLKSKSHTDGPSSKTSHLSESINFGRTKSGSKSGKLSSKRNLLSQAQFSRQKDLQEDDEQASKSSAISCSSVKVKQKSNKLHKSSDELSSQASLLEQSLIASKAKSGSKTGTPPSKKSLLSQTMFSRLKSKSHADEPSSKTSHLSESINFGRRKTSSKSGKLSSKRSLLSQAMFSRQKSSQQDDEQASKSSAISFSSAKVKRQSYRSHSSSQSDDLSSHASLSAKMQSRNDTRKSLLLQSVINEQPSEASLLSESIISSKGKSKSQTKPSKTSLLSCKPKSKNKSDESSSGNSIVSQSILSASAKGQSNKAFSRASKSQIKSKSTIEQPFSKKSLLYSELESKIQDNEVSSDTSVISESRISIGAKNKGQPNKASSTASHLPQSLLCKPKDDQVSEDLSSDTSITSQSVISGSRSPTAELSTRQVFWHPVDEKRKRKSNLSAREVFWKSLGDGKKSQIPLTESVVSQSVFHASKSRSEVLLSNRNCLPQHASFKLVDSQNDERSSEADFLSHSISKVRSKSPTSKREHPSRSTSYKPRSRNIDDRNLLERSQVIPVKPKSANQTRAASYKSKNLDPLPQSVTKSKSQAKKLSAKKDVLLKYGSYKPKRKTEQFSETSLVSQQENNRNQVEDLSSEGNLLYMSQSQSDQASESNLISKSYVSAKEKSKSQTAQLISKDGLTSKIAHHKSRSKYAKDERPSDTNIRQKRKSKQHGELSAQEVFWKGRYNDQRGEDLSDIDLLPSSKRTKQYDEVSVGEVFWKGKCNAYRNENLSETSSANASNSAYYKSKCRTLPPSNVKHIPITNYKKVQKQDDALSLHQSDENFLSHIINKAEIKNQTTKPILRSSLLSSSIYNSKNRFLRDQLPSRTNVSRRSTVSFKEIDTKRIDELPSQEEILKLKSDLENNILQSVAYTKRNDKSNSIKSGSSLLSQLLHLKSKSDEYPSETDTIAQSSTDSKERSRKQQLQMNTKRTIQNDELSSEDNLLSHSIMSTKTGSSKLASSRNRRFRNERSHTSEKNRRQLDELFETLKSGTLGNEPSMNISLLSAKTKNLSQTAELVSKPEQTSLSDQYKLKTKNINDPLRVDQNLLKDSSYVDVYSSDSSQFSKARQNGHSIYSRLNSNERLSQNSIEPQSFLSMEENIRELPSSGILSKLKSGNQSDEQPSETSENFISPLLVSSKEESDSQSNKRSSDLLAQSIASIQSRTDSETARLVSKFLLQTVLRKSKTEHNNSMSQSITPTEDKHIKQINRMSTKEVFWKLKHSCQPSNTNIVSESLPVKGKSKNKVEEPQLKREHLELKSERQPSEATLSVHSIISTEEKTESAQAPSKKSLSKSMYYKLRIRKKSSNPSSETEFALQPPKITSRSTTEKLIPKKNLLLQSRFSSPRKRNQSNEWPSDNILRIKDEERTSNKNHDNVRQIELPLKGSIASQSIYHASTNKVGFDLPKGSLLPQLFYPPQKTSLVQIPSTSLEASSLSNNEMSEISSSSLSPPAKIDEHPSPSAGTRTSLSIQAESESYTDEQLPLTQPSMSIEARSESNTEEQSSLTSPLAQSSMSTETNNNINTDEKSSMTSLSHSITLKRGRMSQSNKQLSKTKVSPSTSTSPKSKSRKSSKSSLMYYARPEDTIPEVEKEEDASSNKSKESILSKHISSEENLEENSSQNKIPESSSKEIRDLDESVLDCKESAVESEDILQTRTLETIRSEPSVGSLPFEESKHKSSHIQTEISKSSKTSQSSAISLKNDNSLDKSTKSSTATSSEESRIDEIPVQNKSFSQEIPKSSKTSQSSVISLKHDPNQDKSTVSTATSSENSRVSEIAIRNKCVSLQLEPLAEHALKSERSLTDSTKTQNTSQASQISSAKMTQVPCMCNTHKYCRRHANQAASTFNFVKPYNNNVQKSSQVLSCKLNRLPFVCNRGDCRKQTLSTFNFVKAYEDNVIKSSKVPSVRLNKFPNVCNTGECYTKQSSAFNLIMPSKGSVRKSSSALSLMKSYESINSESPELSKSAVSKSRSSYKKEKECKCGNERLNTETLKALENKIDAVIKNTCTPSSCKAIKQLETKIQVLENFTFQNQAAAVIKNLQNKVEALEKACSPSKYNVETVKEIQNKIEDFEKVCPESCYNTTAIKNLQNKIDRLEKMLTKHEEYYFETSSGIGQNKCTKLSQKLHESRTSFYNTFRSKFNLRKNNSKKFKSSQLECDKGRPETNLYAAYLLSPDASDFYKLEDRKQSQKKLIEEISTELLMQRNELRELKVLLKHHLSQIYKDPKLFKNKTCNILYQAQLPEHPFHDGKLLEKLSHSKSPLCASKFNNISLDFLKRDKSSPIDINYYTMFDWTDIHRSDNLLLPTTTDSVIPRCCSCPATCCESKRNAHVQDYSKSEVLHRPHVKFIMRNQKKKKRKRKKNWFYLLLRLCVCQ